MRLRSLLVPFALAAALPGAASAASIAYVDNGEVWLSSLDGAQKARLATPVVNGEGDTETWLDVAQSDGGRIVAVRNKPGRISRFSTFRVWEPDGSSSVEGPLNAPSGWTTYVYPLGFDITADGQHLVYGFSNTSSCCPINFSRGTYVRPATTSVLDPVVTAGQQWPSLFGRRAVTASGSTVSVQNAGTGEPYGTEFTPWLDTSGTGLEQRRTDVSADGRLAAIELEEWTDGTRTTGKIAVVAIQGVDQTPAFPAAVDCFVPATGVATDASLSQDGKLLAWTDGAGLKVAGTPTSASDPCVMTSSPVLVSPTGAHGSIGAADVARFLPAPPAPPSPPTAPPPAAPGGTAPPGGNAAPVVTPPARPAATALARGIAIRVRVAGAGTVRVTATVAARVLGRRGRPVVVASGSSRASGAGTVTVRLRVKPAHRKRLRRLRGARMTLRVTHGGRTTVRTMRLR